MRLEWVLDFAAQLWPSGGMLCREGPLALLARPRARPKPILAADVLPHCDSREALTCIKSRARTLGLDRVTGGD